MVFTELRFFLFLFIVIVLFALFKNIRKQVLLTASIIFYAAWDYRFLFLLLFTAFFAHYIWNLITNTKDNKNKKIFLSLWILVHIWILFVFKYFNFFLDSIWAIVWNTFSALHIILPLWISFFTFQALSYIIDLYRGKINREESLFNFTFYIIFFPQLIAGPIIRASEFLYQLDKKELPFTKDNLLFWSQIFLIWLFKKVVIADNLSVFSNGVFAEPLLYDTLTNWLWLLAYSLQLFYDFSWYSDMAIWIWLIFWFTFPRNFDFPYLSKSITEFWRRWHMTLSSFVKDYLYIPLWWNRCSKLRSSWNLIFSMWICGLWHGAGIMFILWGLFHWILLVIDKISKNIQNYIPNIVKWLITMFLVSIWWAMFRAENLSIFLDMINRLFIYEYNALYWPFRWLFLILPLVVIHHLIYLKYGKDYILWKWKSFFGLFFIIFAIIFIFFTQPISSQEFLYFQF